MNASASVHLVCPHCGSVNRAPAGRLVPGARGRCGQCRGALLTGHPLALDEAGLNRYVENEDLPLLVDFWAPWCGPCRMMAPQFEAAAATLEPRVRLAKVNSDEAAAVSSRLGIRSIPTLVLFRGGREIARQSGAMGEAQIRRWVEQHL